MPLSAVRPCRTRLAAAWLALLAALPMHAAQAAATFYAGSFVDDDELWSLQLSLPQARALEVHTLSYGGGPNGSGDIVAAGGFAPVLSLFDASGLLLQSVSGSANDCGGNGAAVDPASGFCWDAGFSAALAAGDYTLVLSQDGNLPFGPYLLDGYSMAGSPDYTGLAWLGIAGQRFINPDLSRRDGHWALEIGAAAAMAEPATAGLLATALVALAAAARRRRWHASL